MSKISAEPHIHVGLRRGTVYRRVGSFKGYKEAEVLFRRLADRGRSVCLYHTCDNGSDPVLAVANGYFVRGRR